MRKRAGSRERSKRVGIQEGRRGTLNEDKQNVGSKAERKGEKKIRRKELGMT